MATFRPMNVDTVAITLASQMDEDDLVHLVFTIFEVEPAARERILGAAMTNLKQTLVEIGAPEVVADVEEAERRTEERW